MVFQNNLLMGAASASGGTAHTVGNSVILASGDSANFSRTNATPTDLNKWTYSTWVKRGKLGVRQTWGLSVFTSSTAAAMQFHNYGSGSFDTITVSDEGVSGTSAVLRTNAEFRDPHSWYHIVNIYDTDNATEALRFRLFVNGVEITDFATDTIPSSGATSAINTGGATQYLGRQAASSNYGDGYIAEAVFCDGQAYEPENFGEYDSNKVWIPKDPSGLTFGDNGFYLDFADSSALGNDISGNNNDFTANNLAAGDQSTDTPTNNQCVISPIHKSSSLTLEQGNLKIESASNDYFIAMSSMAIPSSGKWAMEWDIAAADTYPASMNFYIIGVMKVGDNNTLAGAASGYYLNIGSGEINKQGSVVVDTGGPLNGTFRVEYDADNDTIAFFDDGTEVFPASTGASDTVGLTGQDSLHFGIGCYKTAVARFSNLSGTPSTGFKELSPANLSTPTITDGSQYFQPTLYTGNGSARNIDQTGNSTFQPDFVWIKNRSQADDNKLFNSASGATKYVESNTSDAETTDTNSLTSFDSDGFGLGSGAGGFNDNTENFVAWQWLAGAGSGSSNTDGSTNTTTTTVNTTSGISISTFPGNNGSVHTIGHGLGVKPDMIWVWKVAAAGGWTYHGSIDATAPEDYGIVLYGDSVRTDAATLWNDTAPTSSVFTVGTSSDINSGTGSNIGIAFASIEGFSKFGKYYGTGSATIPPLVTMGFKPSLVIIKKATGTGNWLLYDNARSPYNEIDDQLIANTNAAETTGSEEITFLSNGFAPAATDSDINSSGATYIYAAWAANPFGGEETTPSTAY